jgi:hypothetical protein
MRLRCPESKDFLPQLHPFRTLPAGADLIDAPAAIGITDPATMAITATPITDPATMATAAIMDPATGIMVGGAGKATRLGRGRVP